MKTYVIPATNVVALNQEDTILTISEVNTIPGTTVNTGDALSGKRNEAFDDFSEEE